MLNQSRSDVLKALKNLQYQNSVEKLLNDRIEKIEISKDKKKSSSGHFCYHRIRKYENNIKCLHEIREKLQKEKKLNLKFSVDDSEEEIIEKISEIKKNRRIEVPKVKAEVSLPENDEEIKALAHEISVYFAQGYEMYKTSIDTDISSSPIIEYYAMLQIIKAIILLELAVDSQEFFGAHGLERKKVSDNSSIFQVKTRTHGVFAALLLRTCDFYINSGGEQIQELPRFYDDYYPKFEDLVNKHTIEHSLPEAFILLWMLSELARYQPMKWKEICSGENNNWMVRIDEFREEGIPKIFNDLMIYHCR